MDVACFKDDRVVCECAISPTQFFVEDEVTLPVKQGPCSPR